MLFKAKLTSVSPTAAEVPAFVAFILISVLDVAALAPDIHPPGIIETTGSGNGTGSRLALAGVTILRAIVVVAEIGHSAALDGVEVVVLADCT